MITSVLAEINSQLLLFSRVSILLESCLGDAYSHVVPFQRSMDVDRQGNATEMLHSVEKAFHLKHDYNASTFFTRWF